MLTGQQLAQKYIAEVWHVHHVPKRISRLRPLNPVHQGTLKIPLPPACCLGLYPTMSRFEPVGSTLCICNLLALSDGSRDEIFVLDDGPVGKPPGLMGWQRLFT